MTSWPPAQLGAIDADAEIDVAAARPDGTLRPFRTIWHVVVDHQLYIRSVRGTAGAWYRGVERTGTGRLSTGRDAIDVTFARDDSRDELIDQAYRDKYGSGSPVRAITSAQARATTLRVEPA
ncbi:MAG: DUF2255 family protein [Phycicoccus sp.]|nr:DUF2255 family protein [Phycicoccus sp.]